MSIAVVCSFMDFLSKAEMSKPGRFRFLRRKEGAYPTGEGQRVIADEGFAPARHEKEEGETADVEGDRRKDGRVVTCGEKETRRNLRELKERPVRLCRLTGRIFCGGDEEI